MINLNHNRLFWGRALAFMALFAAACAGYNVRWLLPQGQFAMDTAGIPIPIWAVIWGAVAAISITGAVWLLRPTIPLHQFGEHSGGDPTYPQIRLIWVAVGIGVLAIMAEANANRVFKQFELPYDVQAALFCAGVTLLAGGMGCFSDRLPRLNAANVAMLRLKFRALATNRTVWALIGLVLIGFALRTWRLGDLIHTGVDETDYFGGVLDFETWPTQRLLDPLDDGTVRATHFYSYFNLITTTIWGKDLFGLRMTAAILGTLTILAVFFLARTLFDTKTGLLAAVILAVLPVHVHFSRSAIFNIADPFFATLGFGLLMYGLRHNATRAYILAGLCLGVVTYLYEGGRFMFLAFAVGWLVVSLIWLRPRKHLRGLALMITMIVLVSAPFYYNLSKNNQSVTQRLDEQGGNIRLFQENAKSMGLPGAAEYHLRNVFQFVLWRLVYTPDPSNLYYPVGTGLIPWYIALILWLGVIVALVRLRYAGWFLLAWVAVGCAGISLIATFEWSPRFGVLFPALAVLIAIGLRYPIEMVWPRRWLGRRIAPRGSRQAILIGLALMAAAGLTDYFAQMPDYNKRVRQYFYTSDYVDALYRVIEYAPGGHMVVITDDRVNTGVIDIFRAFFGSVVSYTVWKPADVTPERIATTPLDRTLVFAVPPSREDVIGTIKSALNAADLPDTPFDTVPVEQRFGYSLCGGSGYGSRSRTGIAAIGVSPITTGITSASA